MAERGYDLHGVRLGLSTGGLGERASAALLSRLARIPEDGLPPHDLAFELRAGAGAGAAAAGPGHPFGRPEGARTVYEPPVGEVVYADGADLLYIEAGPRLRVLSEAASGRTRVSVLGEDEEDLWLLSHPLFTIPLMEMLKRRGIAASLSLPPDFDDRFQKGQYGKDTGDDSFPKGVEALAESAAAAVERIGK